MLSYLYHHIYVSGEWKSWLKTPHSKKPRSWQLVPSLFATRRRKRRRMDAYELWCWRRLLRVPWTARRSNQSILKEISPGCSFEGLMLKLKLQYFGHLMRRADSLEKTLMLGKIEGGRRKGWQRMRWLDDIADSMDVDWVDSGSWWWTGRPGMLRFMGSQRVGHDWATELNWTESGNSDRFYFLWLQNHWKNACFLQGKLWQT